MSKNAQQQRAEQEEEFITNRLTKRLTQLKQEKQNLANEVRPQPAWWHLFIVSALLSHMQFLSRAINVLL